MKESLKGTNFWVQLVLAVGALFVGFPADDAQHTVELLFATIAGVFAIREKVKDAAIDWRAWLVNKNVWGYIGGALTALLPTIPGQLFQEMPAFFSALLGGNWQGILASLFSIGTIVYFWLRPTSPKK